MKSPRPQSLSGEGWGTRSGSAKPGVWSVMRSSIWSGVKSASATGFSSREWPTAYLIALLLASAMHSS